MAEASEQLPMVEMDEVTIAPDPPITYEDLISEPSLRVTVVQ